MGAVHGDLLEHRISAYLRDHAGSIESGVGVWWCLVVFAAVERIVHEPRLGIDLTSCMTVGLREWLEEVHTLLAATQPHLAVRDTIEPGFGAFQADDDAFGEAGSDLHPEFPPGTSLSHLKSETRRE